MKKQDIATGLEIIESDLLFYPLSINSIRPTSKMTKCPNSGTIQRDQNYGILLELKGVEAIPQGVGPKPHIRLGTISKLDFTAAQSDVSRCQVQINGISFESEGANLATGDFFITGHASQIIEELQSTKKVDSIIVYFLGFPSDMPSRGSERNSMSEIVLQRPNIPELGHLQKITKPAIQNSLNYSNDCILIKTKSDICLFSKGKNDNSVKKINSSYLHFVSGPTVHEKNKRYAFIEAVNFAFGKRFVEIGYTSLDVEQNPIIRCSNAPYTLNLHTEIFLNEIPPTNHLREYGYIDEEIIAKIVGLFLEARSKFKLSDALWYVWTARMMPLGLELVAYGAALEALVNSWFDEKEKAKSVSTYVSSEEFSKHVLSHIESIEKESPKTSPWDKVIRNIKNSNRLSISERYKFFFNDLGLKIGGVESEVIKARNKFAHGGSFSSTNIEKLIVIARSYEALLNRCILKLIGFSGSYKDYSSLDFPSRPLEEPLGGPNGDGNI